MLSIYILATKNNLILNYLTVHGWKIIDGKLECDWDSEEKHFTAVRNPVSLLFKGCSCSTHKQSWETKMYHDIIHPIRPRYYTPLGLDVKIISEIWRSLSLVQAPQFDLLLLNRSRGIVNCLCYMN